MKSKEKWPKNFRIKRKSMSYTHKMPCFFFSFSYHDSWAKTFYKGAYFLGALCRRQPTHRVGRASSPLFILSPSLSCLPSFSSLPTPSDHFQTHLLLPQNPNYTKPPPVHTPLICQCQLAMDKHTERLPHESTNLERYLQTPNTLPDFIVVLPSAAFPFTKPLFMCINLK